MAYNSCRDRHCPKCQSSAREHADREADLLPAPYFHVVCTVPGEIAAIAWQNKRLVYAILFEAVAETLKTIAADPRHRLGGELGFIAILHSWGQVLSHHPHIHCLVPGGGFHPQTNQSVHSVGQISSDPDGVRIDLMSLRSKD